MISFVAWSLMATAGVVFLLQVVWLLDNRHAWRDRVVPILISLAVATTALMQLLFVQIARDLRSLKEREEDR